MKSLLFPLWVRPIGWALFALGVLLGLYVTQVGASGIMETIFIDTVIISIIVGALFIVFSRERVEDEMTSALRLRSLQLSLYIYCAVLIVCTLFINGINFLYVALYNMVAFPIIHVITFRVLMHRYYNISDNEE